MSAPTAERGTWFDSSQINAALEFYAENLSPLSARPPTFQEINWTLRRRRERRDRIKHGAGGVSRFDTYRNHRENPAG